MRSEAVAAAEPDAVERLRLLFREQVLIHVRDYPDFVPLFMRIHLPGAELREKLLDLRRDHEAVFQRVAAQVRLAQGLDRSTESVALRVAFGALAYLQDWYDPDGPMDAEELADRIARTLIGPFLARGDRAVEVSPPGCRGRCPGRPSRPAPR